MVIAAPDHRREGAEVVVQDASAYQKRSTTARLRVCRRPGVWAD